jgi:transketolase
MLELTDEKIKELEAQAKQIRIAIIEMLLAAGSGHTAGPLDMADIFTALYFGGNESVQPGLVGSRGILHYDPKRPDWPERDRLVLSNGHICPVLYATMAYAGYFPVDELKTLRKFGSRLQGHPHREWLPMLETSSGPLGCGLSQAVGMALADKLDQKGGGKKNMENPQQNSQSLQSPQKFFYCLLGDGELDEGQNWEAAMLAGKNKLGNLIAIVDRNNIQIDGFTEDIMPLEPIVDKWRAFNFHVQEIDGHNFRQIAGAIGEAQAVFDKPSVIIAHTVASKGVPEFERKYEWHGKPPNKEEAEIALRALGK